MNRNTQSASDSSSSSLSINLSHSRNHHRRQLSLCFCIDIWGRTACPGDEKFMVLAIACSHLHFRTGRSWDKTVEFVSDKQLNSLFSAPPLCLISLFARHSFYDYVKCENKILQLLKHLSSNMYNTLTQNRRDNCI